MPARLDLTPEQLRERVARRRDQNRLAQQRHRARHADGQHDAALNGAHPHEGADARSTAFLVTPFPTEREEEGTSDVERVRRVLAPLRGYVHDAEHLELLAATYPDVKLLLEAIGMASWLRDNPKRKCSAAFITNWVKRAHVRRKPGSVLAGVLEQIATDPVAGPSTWH